MKLKNIYLHLLVVTFFFSIPIQVSCGTCPEVCYTTILYTQYCDNPSCDTPIKGAMGKQRDALENRLKDFIKTLKAIVKQTKNQTEIIESEVLAYRRLRDRVNREAILLDEMGHVSSQIRESSLLGASIRIKGEKK